MDKEASQIHGTDILCGHIPGSNLGLSEDQSLSGFADSLLISPTAMGGGFTPTHSDGLNIDFQEIADYFNLPSPLPSRSPSVAGQARGPAFSFDHIPQVQGRVNPLVAQAQAQMHKHKVARVASAADVAGAA